MNTPLTLLCGLLTGFLIGLCAVFAVLFGYGLWFSWWVTEE